MESMGSKKTPAAPFVHPGVQGRDRRAVPARRPVGRPGRQRLRPDRDLGPRMGEASRAGRRDASGRRPDHGGTAGTGAAAAGEPAGCARTWTSSSGRQFSSPGRPGEHLPVHRGGEGEQRNVKRACELLKVSRAAFYQHLSGPSPRERADAELAAEIKAVHAESKGRYGSPRVHAQLARDGRRHGRKRVARIMRSSGLRGRAAKRWKRTTIADPAAAARADQVRRDFTANAARSTPAGAATSPTSRRGRDGCTWPPSSTSPPAASSATRWLITCAPSLVADALVNAVAARDPRRE